MLMTRAITKVHVAKADLNPMVLVIVHHSSAWTMACFSGVWWWHACIKCAGSGNIVFVFGFLTGIGQNSTRVAILLRPVNGSLVLGFSAVVTDIAFYSEALVSHIDHQENGNCNFHEHFHCRCLVLLVKKSFFYGRVSFCMVWFPWRPLVGKQHHCAWLWRSLPLFSALYHPRTSCCTYSRVTRNPRHSLLRKALCNCPMHQNSPIPICHDHIRTCCLLHTKVCSLYCQFQCSYCTKHHCI